MNTNKVHKDFKTSQWKLENPYLSEEKKLVNIMYLTPFSKMGCSGKKYQYTLRLLFHKYPEKAMMAMLHRHYTTALARMKELTV